MKLTKPEDEMKEAFKLFVKNGGHFGAKELKEVLYFIVFSQATMMCIVCAFVLLLSC